MAQDSSRQLAGGRRRRRPPHSPTYYRPPLPPPHHARFSPQPSSAPCSGRMLHPTVTTGKSVNVVIVTSSHRHLSGQRLGRSTPHPLLLLSGRRETAAETRLLAAGTAAARRCSCISWRLLSAVSSSQVVGPSPSPGVSYPLHRAGRIRTSAAHSSLPVRASPTASAGTPGSSAQRRPFAFMKPAVSAAITAVMIPASLKLLLRLFRLYLCQDSDVAFYFPLRRQDTSASRPRRQLAICVQSACALHSSHCSGPTSENTVGPFLEARSHLSGLSVKISER